MIKELSVIIPVYNNKKLTEDCLISLNQHCANHRIQILVIDNGSTDGTDKLISDVKNIIAIPIKYIRNSTNLGFAKASNIGAENAEYENLLFLNNDTVITTDFIEKPLILLSQSDVGAVGIKLLYPDGLIQHAGIVFNNCKKPFHIYRLYESEYNPANISKEYQAVTGACLFIKKNTFQNFGRFDENYRNGWEDMDLCFRLRKGGKKIYYCADSFIYHLESQTEGRLISAKENSDHFYKNWSSDIITDEYSCYNPVGIYDGQKYKRISQLSKLNFAIKIGVPNRDQVNQNWGDKYYAEGLANAIREAGHRCVIHYLNEWNQEDSNIDVVIHLKGLSKYRLKKNNFNIIWILNHPELHSIEELNSYDLVISASDIYYGKIKAMLKVPSMFLPQASDYKYYIKDWYEGEKDIDVLFIGNNYEKKNNKSRKIVNDLLQIMKGSEYKLNLQIYGQGWEGFIDPQYFHNPIDRKTTFALYQRAKIVLNDHQETMRNEGFINNRTYDIALSKSFQISDYVAGIDELGISTYNTLDELKEILDYYLINGQERQKAADISYDKCKSYDFNVSSREILRVLNEICLKSGYTTCNICGHEGNDFREMGTREKVRCPKCQSLERQRALWFLLNDRGLINPGKKVLEIAPLNNLVFRKQMEDRGLLYTCIDKWRHGNPLDPRDTTWIDFEMDICDLKFNNEEFDLIIMQHVIEEVPNDYRAFSEICRVLKKSGTAVIEVPHVETQRITYEYGEARQYGNVRKYGVDFYSKLKALFYHREEVKIDNIPFSILGKIEKQNNVCFPIFIDHSAENKEQFESRLTRLIHLLNKAGFNSISSAQAENFLNGNVFYRRPFWITFDDGKNSDISKGLPILEKSKNYATSFIIPSHLEKTGWEPWVNLNNKFLDVQCHSLSHQQHFISGKLIGIYEGQTEFNNVQFKKIQGYPVFEYDSKLAHKGFIPYEEVIKFSLEFYKSNHNCSKDEYLQKLTAELAKKFELLGFYQSDAEYLNLLHSEIIESKKIIEKKLKREIIAFSSPWGKSGKEALGLIEKNYSISVGVLPQKINYKISKHDLNRVIVNSKAYAEFLNNLHSFNNWEVIKYRSEPSVCVIMTTYNRLDSIADSIQSVIYQTFKDWNLVIVNDGGEDVQNIIDSFDDSRIKYLNIAHGGKSRALNYAIANSRSKYIAYLDDDDKYHPNHLETLITYLKKHPECSFVYSSAEEVVLELVENVWTERERYVKYRQQISLYHLRFMNYIPNLCALHKRTLFDAAGLYDESLNVLIDWDMYRRLAVYAAPKYLNIVTAEYTRKLDGNSILDGQITGMFKRDPVKYYENRLKILSKNIDKYKEFQKDKNCAVIYVTNKNSKELKYYVYKAKQFLREQHFELIFLLDQDLNIPVLEAIQAGESNGIITIWNHRKSEKGKFWESVFNSHQYKKILIYDDLKSFNLNSLEIGFGSNKDIVNYSRSFCKLFNFSHADNIQKPNISNLTVSIIIPTYNNWKLTNNCLKSIFENKANIVNYEVIVIDNGSIDETPIQLRKLKKKYPRLKYHLNGNNYGYAKANNIAADLSNSDFLLFLNNDTITTGNWIDEMISEYLENPNTAIVGAKLLYPKGKIQHAGICVYDKPQPIYPFHIYHEQDSFYPAANYSREYQAVTGACMLISRSIFLELGKFDENFRNGYEDVDLCFIARKKGYKIRYTPKVEIYHLCSQTDGRFDHVEHNIKLLHDKWLGKIIRDEYQFKPVLSIIIPVHNQLEYTKGCLDSVLKNTHLPYEIIVVNDASNDGTSEFLEKFEFLKQIKSEENIGYPKACNLGINEAKGDYIILLNNDVVVTSGWIEGLLETASSDHKIGIVGPACNYISGFQFDPDANYKSLNELEEYSSGIRESRKYSWMKTPRIAFVCALIKRDVIQKIGGLDERFSPGNFEDDDYCLRTGLAGYNIYIAYDTFVHHYGSKSFKAEENNKYEDLINTNKIKFVEKWGADPEQIWIYGKMPSKTQIYIPLKNHFINCFDSINKYLEDEDYEKALEEIELAIELYDESDIKNKFNLNELFKIAGEIALSSKNYEKAQFFFESELEFNANSYKVCQRLGEMIGFPKEHNSLNEEVIEKVNETIREKIHNVSRLSENGNYSETVKNINLIEKTIELEIQEQQELLAETLNMKGTALLRIDETEAARESFEKALNLNPNSSNACRGLAEIFFISENYKEAKIMYEWALKNNADNTAAVEGLKKVNRLLNLPEEDNTLLEEDSRNLQTIVDETLVNAYEMFQNKEYENSLKLLTEIENYAIENETDNLPDVLSSIKNFKGFNFLALNEIEEARNSFEKALNLNPSSSQACAGLAELLFIEGKDNESKTMFEWAVKNDPENSFGIVGLEKINRVLGLPINHNTLNILPGLTLSSGRIITLEGE